MLVIPQPITVVHTTETGVSVCNSVAENIMLEGTRSKTLKDFFPLANLVMIN